MLDFRITYTLLMQSRPLVPPYQGDFERDRKPMENKTANQKPPYDGMVSEIIEMSFYSKTHN